MEVRGRVLPPPKLQYGGRVSSISGQVSLTMLWAKSDGSEKKQILLWVWRPFSVYLSSLPLLHFVCHQNLIFHFHTFDKKKIFFLSDDGGEEASHNKCGLFSIVVHFIISMRNCNKISKKRLQCLRRTRSAWPPLTREFGICEESSSSPAWRFVFGPSLALHHSVQCAKMLSETLHSSCRRFPTTLECQSSDSRASASTLLDRIRWNRCSATWKILSTNCSLS